MSTKTVPFSVSGKTAIITGAGSGINFCFTQLLLAHGCNVLIADLSLRPEAQQLVDAHSSRASTTKPRALFVETNVVNFDQLAQVFSVADQEFGGADIVCPGAGVYEPHWSNFWLPPGSPQSKDPLHGTTAEGLGHYAVLDINLTHPIRCTQLAISHWLNPSDPEKKVSSSNPKRVVHISSIAGQAPGFSTPLYNASKHAISGFIRSLARLDATLGIRVNGVAPGLIKTPLWTEHPEKLRMIDEKRDTWVDPEEVAQGMYRCLVDKDVVGGSVMEILKGTFRKVDWRNDPGPQGPGAEASFREVLCDEVFTWLNEPGWGTQK